MWTSCSTELFPLEPHPILNCLVLGSRSQRQPLGPHFHCDDRKADDPNFLMFVPDRSVAEDLKNLLLQFRGQVSLNSMWQQLFIDVVGWRRFPREHDVAWDLGECECKKFPVDDIFILHLGGTGLPDLLTENLGDIWLQRTCSHPYFQYFLQLYSKVHPVSITNKW